MAAPQQRSPMTRRAAIALWLLLAACLLCGCRTLASDSDLYTLDAVTQGLFGETLSDSDVVMPHDRDLPEDKRAMDAWLSSRIGAKYRALFQGYVLTEPGFAQWDTLESNADRYMQAEWQASRLPQQAGNGHGYRILFWKLKKKDRYFALVMTRDPVAGQDGRHLAGYYELRDSSAPLPADVLVRIQRWATPTPPDRLLPAHEHANEKTAMARWLERYLDHDYRIVRQRFVLTEPGFTDGAAIVSQANQYVQSTLGGTQKDFAAWPSNEYYQIIAWNVGSDRKRHLIAMVQTRDFVPGTNERTLIGYFHLSARDDE